MKWIAAIAAALLIAVPQAAAKPSNASCGHGTRTLAAVRALTEYDDDILDVSLAPDFCAGELVTNDNETITIGIHVHNRNGFVAGDHYTALIDTNPATSGPEFEIAFDGSGAALERWAGTAFARMPETEVVMDWLPTYGPVLSVELADLGNPSAFGLVLVSTNGADTDRAPDAGSWPYSVTPLALNVRSLTLGRARAGQMFAARAVVWRSDWDLALTEGRITCLAKLGTRSLVGRGSFSNDGVNC